MDGKDELVLVVEDSETQALKMMALLEEAGVRAWHSATAEDALDYLGRNRPNLIVIDYHLPRMRGDELCRQIRMNSATSDILVLILTDDAKDSIERQGLESGADDYVPKSVESDALMARIHALLRNQKRRADSSRRSHASFFQKHRVAVVDDSLTYLEYLKGELVHEGYEVVTFEDGEEALDYLTKSSCDCLLVDLVMPRMNGIELCLKLDTLRIRSGSWFPLLMVTGRDSKEDMMQALEAGADDFVSKSGDIAILRARIRALLRRKVQRDEHERISNEFRGKELEVVRERTEREAAERRAALAEQLELANQELRETQAHLVQAAKMASLGELVAGIAHEINNPLAYVMSHLDTMERALNGIAKTIGAHSSTSEAKLFEKAQVRMGDMRGGLERVRDLVVKLRTFSRLDEGAFKKADMRENIESVLVILHHRLGERIEVDTTYANDNVIWCFPAPLNQVVMNLLSNAIDAVEGEGAIQVRTERDDSDFRIVVADTGHGVAPEIQERIFEPFFTTKPVGQGVGLGLAITYRIVQSHRGRIEARNRDIGGAEFVVTIPLNLAEVSNE
jgi:two-component system NtrC family sensor kinase